MTPLKNAALLAASLGLLVAVLSVSAPEHVSAQLTRSVPTVPVIVTNPPSEPVNVAGTATVTGKVSIAGTPSVSATQSGPWTVALAGGLPPLTFPADATVTVGNPSSNPVLVRDVANGGKRPFQASGGCFFEEGYCVTDLATVPAGRRLVIEHFSMNIQMSPQQNVINAIIGRGFLGPNTLPVVYPIDYAVPQLLSGTTVSHANHHTLMFFDEGDIVRLQLTKDTTESGGGTNAYISGYLMDR